MKDKHEGSIFDRLIEILELDKKEAQEVLVLLNSKRDICAICRLEAFKSMRDNGSISQGQYNLAIYFTGSTHGYMTKEYDERVAQNREDAISKN